MNVEFINPFVDAAAAVFRTMLHCEVRRVGLSLAESNSPEFDITGIIGMSGKASGDVVISFEEQVAISAAGAMLGETFTQLDDSVIDTVGELTNMIAGHAKAALEKYDMRLALPTVITGSTHAIRFCSKVTPILIPFDCEWGRFSIRVALTEHEPTSNRPLATAGVGA